MFVGHYAPALVGKAIEPRVPFWMLLAAVQLVDIAWAILVLLGVERVRIVPGLRSAPLALDHMPYIHSLVATAVWASAAFLLARGRFGTRGALVVAAAIASHWLCDLLVHRPDLPLLSGEPKLGLGLSRLPWLASALEVSLLLGAAWWCARNGVVARPRIVLGFALALALVQTAMVLGPQPSTVAATAVGALVFYLVVAAAGFWIERSPAA